MPPQSQKPLSLLISEALHPSAKEDQQLAIKALDAALATRSDLSAVETARVARILELARKPRFTEIQEGNTGPTGVAWPKISIVTPTYNQGQFIEDTILSILNQNYPNLEYIIMDGGSTDNTMEVADKYRDRIATIISEKDKGQSNAINKGMALATGEILYWLNSDDILEPDTLMYVGLRYIQDKFDLLTGACTPFDHSTGLLQNRHIATCPFGLRTEDITDIEATWLKGMYFHQPEVFFSRRIWDAAGGYVDEDLYYSMDYDLWARMAISSDHQVRVFTAGKSFCLFRQHIDQKTSTTEAYLPELLSHSKELRKRHLGRRRKGSFSTAKDYRQKLSIVAISDYGFRGGAGIAHKRLCQVLQAAGHDVIQLSGFREWQSETIDQPICGFKEALDILQPDIVLLGNLHNLRHGLEIAEFSARHYTTIAVAHDFWWITGRCAYTHGCHFLFSQCTQVCPTHSEYPRLNPLEIHVQHQRKKHLLQNPNFHVLANSSHTQELIKNAIEAWGLKTNAIGVVALPIVREGNSALTFPDRTQQVQSWATETKQVRIVVGCTDHADFRKGADLAGMALRQLMAKHKEVQLDVYGRNSDLILDSLPEFSNRILLHGYIENQEQYQEILASGDIFLGTSREETLGQTFVEAAYAGLATVGPTQTGYGDVVSCCRFSFGYTGFNVAGIVRTLQNAVLLFQHEDRAFIRAIQKCQVQASYSGLSFLGDFNGYLYSSGLWKRLRYHAPTKIYDLDYFELEPEELFICESKSAPNPETQPDDRKRRGDELAQHDIPVSSWKLGPHLYHEEVDGIVVAWMNSNSSFLISGEDTHYAEAIEIECHWIPDTMRGTACTMRICGYGSTDTTIPTEGQNIVFNFSALRADGLIFPSKFLVSLVFEHSIGLEDGRHGLALVCAKARFKAAAR